MAIDRTNELLTADDGDPLLEGLTPHTMRHTFASLLAAMAGE